MTHFSKRKIQFQIRENNGLPSEIKIRECFVPVDFVVLDMDVDKETPLILGHPFLSTADNLLPYQWKRREVSLILKRYTTRNVELVH